MPSIRSLYGQGGGLDTSMDLRGVDIGASPDFYGDLGTMVRKLRPRGSVTGSRMASALRRPAAPPSEPMPQERQPVMPAYSGPDPSMVTPRSLGKFMMNNFGQWGTFVDPADIPAGLQDKIMGGFYGQPGNWDTSNPSAMGPQQWGAGKYR